MTDKQDLIIEMLQNLNKKIDNVESSLESKIDANHNEVKIILENDIRGDIKKVAEGHMDLVRNNKNNSDEIERLSKEMDMMLVRIVSLKHELEELKKAQ